MPLNPRARAPPAAQELQPSGGAAAYLQSRVFRALLQDTLSASSLFEHQVSPCIHSSRGCQPHA
jgi:hypothetical protein